MHWFLTLLCFAATAQAAGAPSNKHGHEAPVAHPIVVAPAAPAAAPTQQQVFVVDSEPRELREAHDPRESFFWGASGLLAGVTGLLYLQHGRRRRDRSGSRSSLRLVPSVSSGHTAENQPHAAGDTAVKGAAETMTTTTARTENTDTKLRRTGMRPLPFSLKTYFVMQPREHILWTAPYSLVGRATGMVAVTNKRVLAVHHTRRLLRQPLRLTMETSQDDFLLTSLNKAEIVRTHRTWILAVPALTLWLHPWGLLVAAGALFAYSSWPRRQLALYAGSTRYLYPLPDLDQREMLHLLQQPAAPAKAVA